MVKIDILDFCMRPHPIKLLSKNHTGVGYLPTPVS